MLRDACAKQMVLFECENGNDHILIEKSRANEAPTQTHVGFCYKFRPSLAELGDETLLIAKMKQTIDWLASEEQFAGCTLRFGVSANKNFDVPRHQLSNVDGDDVDDDKYSSREHIMSLLAQEADDRLYNEGRQCKDTSPIHYELFVSGLVPFDGTDEGKTRALNILQEMNFLLNRGLGGVLVGCERLNEESYLNFLHSIAGSYGNPGSGSFAMRRIEMPLKQQAATASDKMSPFLYFGPKSWIFNSCNEIPDGFSIVTSYTFINRMDYQRHIESGVAMLHLAKWLPIKEITGVGYDARQSLEAKNLLQNEWMDGKTLVGVDIEAFVVGSSEADAQKRAEQIAAMTRASGISARVDKSEEMAARKMGPFSEPKYIGHKDVTMLPADKAACMAPFIGGFAPRAGQFGIPLQTSFGAPVRVDFTRNDLWPLTLIVGGGGSGKSHLVWAMASQCLQENRSMFVINENTFSTSYVKALGGEVIETSNSGMSEGFLFVVSKSSVYYENEEQLNLAFNYLAAITSLTETTTDLEKCIFREWLFKTAKAKLEASEAESIGISIPVITEWIENSGVEMLRFRKALKMFARGSEYEKYISPRWPQNLKTGRFIVANHVAGKENLPNEVRIAAYVTLLEMARANIYGVKYSGKPSVIICENIDDILGSSDEVGYFLLEFIRQSRMNDCAVIVTTHYSGLSKDCYIGRELAKMAGHLMVLNGPPEKYQQWHLNELFGEAAANDPNLFRKVKTHAGSHSSMIMRWHGQVGIYKLVPGLVSKRLWNSYSSEVLRIEKELGEGRSLLEALMIATDKNTSMC